MSISLKQSVAAALLAMIAAISSPVAFSSTYKTLDKAPAGEYQLDKTHGYITFSYLHQGYSRPWLRFRDIDATLTIDAENLSQSAVKVDIDPASIDSGVDIFDEHLRGKNFFQVDKHPAMSFESTAFKVDGEQFALVGKLTIKGITKTVELQGQFNQGGTHFKTKKPVLGFSAKTTVMRSDWDLGYAVPFVSDAVDIVIEVEFNQP